MREETKGTETVDLGTSRDGAHVFKDSEAEEKDVLQRNYSHSYSLKREERSSKWECAREC